MPRASTKASPRRRTKNRLEIRDFAHLAQVDITFGDLTILVGAQGTGKSLALQWLKTALDGRVIVSALRDAGQDVSRPDKLVDLIFGVGMGAAYKTSSEISFEGRALRTNTIARTGNAKEQVFFIPAHRAMLISDGWAAPFQKLTAETPVVARQFSQNLFDLFSPARVGERLFPQDRKLKKVYREIIDAAVFHGGTVGIEQGQHARRLKLTHGDSQLPFMTWTAGQREFTPLLLGLYHLLPERNIAKREDINWVVIEEPEMGLHPQAVTAFMLVVLDLLWRGYKVVLATHSPLVVTVAWMLRRLSEHKARWQLVCDGFGVEKDKRAELKKVAGSALEKDVRTYLLHFGADRKVRSKDISSLDPGDDDDDVAGWGGLAGFSSRFGEAVRTAVNEADG